VQIEIATPNFNRDCALVPLKAIFTPRTPQTASVKTAQHARTLINRDLIDAEKQLRA